MSEGYESHQFGFGSHEGQDNGEFQGALFGSELLAPDEASRLLDRGPGRLAVWLGEQGTGKTSISVELYERQRRPGASMRFAGSWTLLAFERLAHERRATGSPPAATRTDLDPEGREILHLALSPGDVPQHLLIADLPGEVFRRLADNQIAVGDILWLQRADKLAILVDGARLCDLAERSLTLTRVRQLAERLRSGGLPRVGTGLALLVTKWDLVRADPAAIAYWEEREGELLTELRVLEPGAVALHVAAGDPTATDGVAALRAWLLALPPAAGGELEATDWSQAAGVAAPEPLSWAAGAGHATGVDAPPDDLRAAADRAPLFAWAEARIEPHATEPDSTSGEAPPAASGSDALHPTEADAPPKEPTRAGGDEAHSGAQVEPAPQRDTTHLDSAPGAAPAATWGSTLIETGPAAAASPPETGPPADAGSAQELPPAIEDGWPASNEQPHADQTSAADASPAIEWGPPGVPPTTVAASQRVRFAWPEEPQRRRRWLPWRRRR